jgi:hypothetical protein
MASASASAAAPLKILSIGEIQTLTPTDLTTYSTQLISTIKLAKETPGYIYSILTEKEKAQLSPSELYTYYINLSTLNQTEQTTIAYMAAYSALLNYRLQASQSTITGISNTSYQSNLLYTSYDTQIKEQQAIYSTAMLSSMALQDIINTTSQEIILKTAGVSALKEKVTSLKNTILMQQKASAATNPLYAEKLNAYQAAAALTKSLNKQLLDASAALVSAQSISSSTYLSQQSATKRLADISGTITPTTIASLRKRVTDLSAQLVSTIAADTVLKANSTIAANNVAYALINSTYYGTLTMQKGAETEYNKAADSYSAAQTAVSQTGGDPKSVTNLSELTYILNAATEAKSALEQTTKELGQQLMAAAAELLKSNLAANSNVITTCISSITGYSTISAKAKAAAAAAYAEASNATADLSNNLALASKQRSIYATAILKAARIAIDASSAAILLSSKQAEVTRAQSSVTGLETTIEKSAVAQQSYSKIATYYTAKAEAATRAKTAVDQQYNASILDVGTTAKRAGDAATKSTEAAATLQTAYYTLAGLNAHMAETNANTAIATETRIRGQYGIKEAALRQERLSRAKAYSSILISNPAKADANTVNRMTPYISSCEALTAARSTILLNLQSTFRLTQQLTPYSVSGDSIKGQIAMRTDSMKSMQAYKALLDTSGAAIQRQLATAILRYSDASGALFAKKANAGTDISGLDIVQTAYETARSRRMNLQSQHDAMVVQIDAYTNQIAATQASIDALNTSLQGITQFSQPLRVSISSMATTVSTLQAQVTTLQTGIDYGVTMELPQASKDSISTTIGQASAP